MSNFTTAKAVRSLINFGFMKPEGYLLPSELWTDLNKFGMSKTQSVLLAYPDFDRSQAAKRYIEIVSSKTAKTLSLSKLPVHRKVKVEGTNERVDLLPANYIVSFLKICKKLGSVAADELIDSLAGLSIQQLFSDAFDIEFNKRDRQDWLTYREKSKEAFWSLGDAIAQYKTSHPERSDTFRAFVFPNCQDALNRGLFGKTASTIRNELGVKDLLRDHYGQVALRRIDLVQSLAASLIVHEDQNPVDAVKQSLGMYRFDLIDYRE